MSLTWSAVCVKYVMFIFNFLFVITGIVILAAGISVKAYYHDYETFLDDKYFSAANLLIAIGVIIFLIAFFGCCGAVKENYCMTVTYSTLLILICVLELAAGISGYILRNDTANYLDKKLTDSLDSYNGLVDLFKLRKKSDDITIIWDQMQTNFQCCGVHGPTDWILKTNSTQFRLPLSCCSRRPGTIEQDSCKINSTTSATLHEIGCVDAFGDYLIDHASTIGGVGIGFCVVQVLGIIFACHLSRKIRDNYETV